MLCAPYFRIRTTLSAAVLISGLVLAPQVMAGVAEAQAYLKQGQHAQALDQVERALSANSKDRQARFLKGVILAEMNKLDEAASVFVKLSEEAPELPEPYNNLAVIYAQQKQYDKAKAALEMAIRTHPSYAVAHENLGDLYAKLARQAYDRALQIDAANSTAQAKLNLIREIISVNARPGAVVASAAKPTVKSVVVQNTPPTPPKPAAITPPPQTTPAAVKPPVVVATNTPTTNVKPAAETEVKKEPKKDAKENSSRNDEKAIRNVIHAWAADWSSKDVRGYLSAYAKDFNVPGGKSRSAWEKERNERINKPGKIKVGLSDIEISVKDDKATVRFRQEYSSSSLNSGTGKTLVMVQRNGRWQIQQERVGR